MIWPRGGWRDLGGVILTAWSWQRDLEGTISPARLVLGRDLAHPLYSLFLLFLSLSLGVCESGNDLKVKQKVNHFLGQRPYFTAKVIYFLENFAVGCKMNSGNHLHPKQMQPIWKLWYFFFFFGWIENCDTFLECELNSSFQVDKDNSTCRIIEYV